MSTREVVTVALRLTAASSGASRPALAVMIAIATAIAPAPAQGQETALTSGAAEIDLSGTLHLQAVTSSCSGFPVSPSSACEAQASGLDVFLRRTELAAGVRITEEIDGEIKADFGTTGMNVRDAWGRLTFSPAARLQVGRFKRPFDGFELTSSSRILTIERDLDVPGVPGLRTASLNGLTSAFHLSGRDIGVMLNGATDEGLAYWAGFFNGEASSANGDRNASKQLVVRGRYAFPVQELPAAIAVAVAHTDLPFTGPEGEIASEYYSDVEIWAELGDFDGGPHVQAGYVFGENPLRDEAGEALPPAGDAPVTGEFARMRAWQVVGAYRALADGNGERGGGLRVSVVEPVLRISRAEPDRGLPDDEVWGFTPGLNLHFAERNRLSLNWDFIVFTDETESASSFKAQYQLWF